MNQEPSKDLQLWTIFDRWWPLALSWMMMAVALPIINAVIARFPAQDIHLAAYGSYVLPLGLMIEAPLLMLLAASTALCTNRKNHRRMWHFMMWLSGVLTVLHILLACTPMAGYVMEDLMGAPDHVLPPARTGLIITIPWTWSVGYRRFHQGVLVRFGHSKVVGIGAMVRISTIGGCLLLGYFFFHGVWSGTVVATVSHAMGVVLEAVFVGAWVRSVREAYYQDDESSSSLMAWKEILQFYAPLAMTSIFSLAVRPLLSTGMARMPQPVDSLAVFPVALGLLFPLRSAGMAYKEVVVALLERKNSYPVLRRFTVILTVISIALLGLIVSTPLSEIWFARISGLRPALVKLGKRGLIYALFIPGLTVVVNAYQGVLVYGKKTRGVVESIVINLLTMAGLLGTGMMLGEMAGYQMGMIAMCAGLITQALWLRYRSQSVLQQNVQVSSK